MTEVGDLICTVENCSFGEGERLLNGRKDFEAMQALRYSATNERFSKLNLSNK